jgi:hypothetical protein
MYDFYDFSAAQFLDSLADLYETRGYAVQYLPFTYSVDWFPLASLATDSRQVEINADADFVCCSLMQIAHDVNGNAIIVPRMLVTVTVDNNQRQLTSRPTPVGNLYGTGPRPGLLFKPLVLPANSTVTISLDNIDEADRNVRLSHVGVKAFLFPSS